MPIPIESMIKGRVAQTLAEVLFDTTEYRVTRLGIEELFREIKSLTKIDYLALSLPITLRILPDLLVAKNDMSKAWLVEVKYRKDISQVRSGTPFEDELREVRKEWPDAHVIVCLGDSPCSKAKFLQDYVRVIPPSKDIEYIVGHFAPTDDEELWDQFYRLSSEFPGFSTAASDLDKILPVIQGLKSV